MIAIDYPRGGLILGAYEWVEGWFAVDDKLELTATIAEMPAALYEIERPDMPGAAVFGFRIYICLYDILRSYRGQVQLRIFKHGHELYTASLTLPVTAWENAVAEKTAQGVRREWIKRNSACPLCHSTALEWGGEPPPSESARCGSCGTEFSTAADSGAFNFLLPKSSLTGSLADKSDPVADHSYGDSATAIFDRAGSHEDMIVDVGAGFRRRPHPRAVTVEIYDYPSTDVLATADAIPLRDGCASAVYCSAVLEHVPNPFSCASEILRILKPGGLLYSSIPFLQPEHGYPFHYFNCTRSGHLELFRNSVDVVELSLGRAGQPWYALMWLLDLYRHGLPSEIRSHFERMSVTDIVSTPYDEMVDRPVVSELSDEVKWRIATSTVLIARKR
ncbi:MAG TPA: class I SAM-dependent methyltransferase [Stellaceae bacterium]|jgi:SAM-dependent methyltransferase|nr:class I SAM-dependent methyltransferase [Stellaceae bacterium]